MPLPARVITATLDVAADTAYAYASRMDLLPNWASGLSSGVKQEGDAWFAESPMGRVRVAMTPRNRFGVLDHDVTLPGGVVVHNALRVTPAGADGCVLSFVVLQMPGTDDTAFIADCAHVQKDLAALKALLEQGVGG